MEISLPYSHSETRLRTVVDTAVDGVILIDARGTILTFNPACERLFGYRAADVIGKNVNCLMPAPYQEEHDRYLDNYHRTGERKIIGIGREVVGRRQDGTTFPMGLSVGEATEDGKTVFVGIIHDLTERVRSDQAIREAATRLWTVADTAVDGLILIDANGLVLMFNRACERLFGYRAEEVIGKNVKCLMPAPYHEEHDRYLDNYHRTGERKIIGIGRQVFGRRKDGTTFPMDLSVGEATEDGKTVFVGIIHDLTERVRSEQAIREAATRLRTVADTAVDGLILIDARGTVLMFNPACERLFGYRAAEVIGKNVKCLMPDPYHQEHDLYLDNYHRTGERKIIGIGREVVGRRNDGSTFPMGLSVGEATEDGKTIFVGIIHDLSERRQAETQLLEKMVELGRSNEELEQFASIASHDLQEPLRIVASYMQLLSRRYKGKLDADADEFIAFAVDGAGRMQRLIQDLLAYSRVGTKGRELCATSGEDALRQALNNLRGAIQDGGAQVTHDPLPTVLADETQLVQVFQNLVGNAIKYHRRGVPKIHISAMSDGANKWIFSVQDNGLGIDPQYFDKIFGMFQRLHKRDEFSGTGIGLAICKKIVERHGGRIWVESQPGQGSIFRFALTASEKKSPISSEDALCP